MTRRPRRKGEETREDILSTAEQLFREQGFSKTTIADIAAALSMSPANVFKHFHSKTALADAIAARHLSRFTERLSSADIGLSAPERLLNLAMRLMEAHLKDFQDEPYLYEMVMMTARSGLPSGKIYRQLIERKFAEIIRDGVEAGLYFCEAPEKTAVFVSACLVGVLHPVLVIEAEHDELPARCRGIVALINNALQNPLAK